MNLVDIARNLGATGRYNDKSDVLIIMTPAQLHAYTEQVCKQMVEALEMVANRPSGMWYGIDDKVKEALASHKEMIGDLYE